MTEIRRGTPADIPGVAAIYNRILTEKRGGFEKQQIASFLFLIQGGSG